MDAKEVVDLGKKIFFLNPPFDFKKIIIPVLSDREYELYILDSYKNAKTILREHPGSICFVCIDGGLPIEHWYNFVVSFSSDPVLSTIFLGVMSAHAGASDRNHFLLNASIPAGFISLASKKEELLEKLEGILKINNAKGIRKYVRVDCVTDKLISAHYKINDTVCPFRIDNISSAGLLCATSPTVGSFFSPNMLLKDFLLVLRSQKIKCNAVILKMFENGGKCFLVLLFTKGLPFASKSAIQAYIRAFLQSSIDSVIASMQPDETDYSKLHDAAIGSDIEDAFLISVDEEEVLYAEDTQEITYADEVEDAPPSTLSSPLFQNEDEQQFLDQMKYLDNSDLDSDVQLIDDTK